MKLTAVSLTHACVSLALIALTSAAQVTPPAKPAQVASTPAAKSKEPAQETPRAMLERAAFLEEHERDFEAAAKLYQQAADAAQSTGDSETAHEARAAYARVMERLGRPIDRVNYSPGSDAGNAIPNRIKQLFYQLSNVERGNNQYHGILSDLEQFGARVVPWAEQALTGRVSFAPDILLIQTNKAADLLAGIDGPEAAQALERALDSPDPVLRRDVAYSLQAQKHRALLEKASRDASPGVRAAAIQQLHLIADPTLVSIMEPAARGKNELAVRWMAEHAPQRLIDLAFEAGADDGLQLMAVRNLHSTPGVPADIRLARSMVQVCLSAPDQSVRRSMPLEIASMFHGSWQGAPPSFRREVESMVLGRYSEFALPQVLDMLKAFGGVATFTHVADTYADKFTDLSSDEAKWIRPCLDEIQYRFAPADFDPLVASYKRWHAPPSSDQAREKYFTLVGGYTNALKTAAKRGVSVDSIVKGWDGLDESKQSDYLNAIKGWMESCWDTAARRFVPESMDARMLPLVRADLAQSLEKNYLARWPVLYATELGDVSSVPVMLTIRRKYAPNTDYAAHAVDTLFKGDPEQDRKAIEDAIIAGWQNPSSETRCRPTDLQYLPSEAILLFERLWPRASTSAARSELFFMLVKLETHGVAPLLFKHYADIDSEDLRGTVITRFGNELYEPAIPLLGEALKSSSDYVRNSARDAFKKFKEYREALEEFSAWMNADQESRASINELTKLLDSNNRDVVIGAVHSLAAVKARSALPALVKLLERPDPELKKTVEEAIAKIGGG